MKGSPKGDSFVIGQNIAFCGPSRGPARAGRIDRIDRPGARKRTGACMGEKNLKKFEKGIDRPDIICYNIDTVKERRTDR